MELGIPAEVEIRKEDVDKSTSDNLHSSVLQFLLKPADIRLQRFADPSLKLSSRRTIHVIVSSVRSSLCYDCVKKNFSFAELCISQQQGITPSALGPCFLS